MGLSNDLLSQFAKVTNDTSKKKKETSTVYGTVVEGGGVKLDGSDIVTPVSTTVDMKAGDRVIVMIKNHSATVTGNLNDPAASSKGVSESSKQITSLGIAVANRVTTEQLNAEKANITKELIAADATIKGELTASIANVEQTLTARDAEIAGKVTAAEGEIAKLKTNTLDAESAALTYATIKNLDATNENVNNLNATHANFENATAKNFEAVNTNIEDLNTKKLDAATAEITYATISDLNATTADITTLKVDVGEINTLIFGSATGTTIQTSFANAVIAQLGNAQIKSAMIDGLSASKITAGDIVTKDIRVMSEDGTLLISDETIQISDGTRVRVQIGKDAENDYSINIWDQNGNLMFSEGGITDKAIKSAIIRNDMVSETANISASKLDINSLFEEINGSTKTIKSSKIYLDDKKQTLDVAFTDLITDVTELGKTVSSQGTQITTIQGQISSKVWQQDIDTATNEMSTKYSSLEQTVDSISTTVSETYVTKRDVGAINLVNDQLPGVTSVGVWENIGDGWIRCTFDNSEGASVTHATYRFAFSDYVSRLPANTPLTVITEMRDLGSTDGTYAYSYPENEEGVNRVQVRGNSYVYAVNARNGATVTRNKEAYVMPESTSGLSKTALGGWIVAIPAGGTVDVLLRQSIYEGVYLGNYVAPVVDTRVLDSRLTNAEESITQNNDSIVSLVRRTEVVENKFADYSTTTEMTSAIEQRANSIESTVSSTYSTKDETSAAIAAIEVGGRNLLLNSETELIVNRNYSHSIAPVELHSDDIFTYSVWLKANEDTTVSVYINDDTGQTRMSLYFSYGTAVTTEYQRFEFVGRRVNTMKDASFVPDTNIRMRVYAPEGITLTGKLAKLELGNKATDWTPAPEDMATVKEVETAQTTADEAGSVASNAETLVKQLSDSISMLVTDGNGTSLMTQTEDGWTFSTADIQSLVNDVSDGLNSLTEEVGDVGSAVDILQQAVNDLGEIAEYVKITTFEDEPCIELGEGDSEFKLRITNTRMIFAEGSTVLAYFTNQSFHSKKVVIEEELQQGGYVWKARANGNLGLTWKGGNN